MPRFLFPSAAHSAFLVAAFISLCSVLSFSCRGFISLCCLLSFTCRGFFALCYRLSFSCRGFYCTLLPAQLFMPRLLFHSAASSALLAATSFPRCTFVLFFFQAIHCGFYGALLEERKFTAVPLLYSNWFTFDSNFFINTLRLSFHQHSLCVICKVLSVTCYWELSGVSHVHHFLHVSCADQCGMFSL